MRVAGMVLTSDPTICITEYCDDLGVEGMPVNPFMWSYVPQCAVSEGLPQCDPLKGCTACPPGSYLVKSILSPAANRCQRCEGCPFSACTATGCSTCTGTLNTRVEVPAVLNAAGQKVFACRDSSRQPKAFKGITTFPVTERTALWPASEFGGCGGNGVAEYMFSWFTAKDLAPSSEPNNKFEIASWQGQDISSLDPAGLSQVPVSFRSNSTTKIIFQFGAENRVDIRFTYIDWVTKKETARVVKHALPVSQDRVCITFANFITNDEADKSMSAQLTIINSSKNRILLRMWGAGRSFTRRIDATFYDKESSQGGVTVFGRSSAILASPFVFPQWNNSTMNAENLVILPTDIEWPELVQT